MSTKRNGKWSVKAKEKDVVNLMCVDNLAKAWLLAYAHQVVTSPCCLYCVILRFRVSI